LGQTVWSGTDGLHLEGFARVLWDALHTSGYATPPTYEATKSLQLGIPSCRVLVTVPLHPNHPEWPDLGMEVVSVLSGTDIKVP
jgi:hypothetical protein